VDTSANVQGQKPRIKPQIVNIISHRSAASGEALVPMLVAADVSGG
jgi:hypothetical protein